MPLQDSVSFFLSQYCTPVDQRGGIATSSQKDETETLESDDSHGSQEGEFGLMTRHPSKGRQRRTDLMSVFVLMGFGLLLASVIIPVSRRKKSAAETVDSTGKQKGEYLNGTNKSQRNETTTSQETKVYCSGRGGPFTFNRWLEQDFQEVTTAVLCDPEFRPSRNEADMSQPVKVFLMLGESNMVGTGQTNGDMEGTLEYTVLNKHRFTHLVDMNKKWQTRSDVRYVAVKGEMTIERNEWLGVDNRYKYFGPELQLGYILGALYDEPVLLLKAAAGHHTLGADLLPPGSPGYNFGEWSYAGYEESPRRWPSDIDPSSLSSTTWYAGNAYDTTLRNIKSIVSKIGDYYPGATKYQIEGMAIWQGDSDRRDLSYSTMYQRNLRNFIATLRADLRIPNAKVAIATIGQLGDGMRGNGLQVLESQMSMGSMYEDFQGNVLPVDIRSSWRGPYLPGYNGDSSMVDAVHYGNNAETMMEVGNALGLAMVKLMNGPP